jgi:hypothetical protein
MLRIAGARCSYLAKREAYEISRIRSPGEHGWVGLLATPPIEPHRLVTLTNRGVESHPVIYRRRNTRVCDAECSEINSSRGASSMTES